MASQGESNLDRLVREASDENVGEESEFDTIARYRGGVQEKVANMLAGHLQGHDNKDAGGESKGIAGRVDEPQGEQESVSEQLHKSSDEAREKVFQANDKTYDAIEEAKKSVERKFNEARHKEGNQGDVHDEGRSSYSAINEAKEKLKGQFGAATGGDAKTASERVPDE